MKMRSTAARTIRLKRFTFQTVLVASLGIPLVVVSDDIKMEIRQRTDRNVDRDIRNALEFQRKLLDSQETTGFTELSQQAIDSSTRTAPNPSRVTIGDAAAIGPKEPFECPPIVIGSPSIASNFAETQHAGLGRDSTQSDNAVDTEARQTPRVPSRAIPFQSEVRNEPSGVVVTPRVEKRLPPPTISQIQGWEPDRRMVSEAESRLAAASRQWKPVRAQIGAGDSEAAVRPQLSSSTALGSSANSIDSAIMPANFQSTPDGFSTPALPPPGLASPSTPMNAAPSAMQPILPGAPPANILPVPPMSYAAPVTQVPGGMVPYNPGNLPTYSSRGSTIINGEPFVTVAPCQFDAYYMMEPTVSMQNPGVTGCGQAAGPGYSGIPGTIVPPTIMPNQAPAGIYSPNNSGFRPLFGFGQDNYNVQLGRGIIGQPVAYVPGQPFRNFLRYIFP